MNILNKIKTYIVCLLLFQTFNLLGQNESNNWYFGQRAGLNFALNQNPTVLFDGEMVEPDACATISDRFGNLQFYTNGVNVWNRNHNIMINGVLFEPLSAGGNPNLTAPDIILNTIIIPITDSNNLYYVFTVGSAAGVQYSIIDMNINNGLGEVIIKNKPLLTGFGIGKISAVHHADGKSIWVMTTKKNENDQYTSFYAYKVNTDGSIDLPVISSNGLFYNGLQEGDMKFSPNGKKIATANYREQELENHLMVFDFDNSSGLVSNNRKLLTSFTFFEIVSAYGVEFSNDSKYLYASLVRQGMFDVNNSNFVPEDIRKNIIYQYDLANPNPMEYAISLFEEYNELTAGSLQLAKNGKIYRALAIDGSEGIEYLGVINIPDTLGVNANYIDKSVNLGVNKSRLGLPTFIQSYFRTRILNEEACVFDPIVLEVDTYAEITEARWDFGDGITSNQISPNHTFTASGKFNVVVTITINNREITTSKMITIHDIPNLLDNQELIECDIDTDGLSTFNLNNIREKITNPNNNEELFFYENLDDAENDINRISNSENYSNTITSQEVFVRVVNSNGCYSISSFYISAVFVELGNTTPKYACDDSDNVPGDLKARFILPTIENEIRSNLNIPNTVSLKFYPSFNDAKSTLNELGRYYITNSTTIWVRAEETDLSCSGLEPVTLIVNQEPRITLNDEYIICKNQPIILSGDISNDRFEWIDNNGNIFSTNTEVELIVPGNYKHIAYRTENGLECSSSKSFIIRQTDAPAFSEIKVDKDTRGNMILVSVEGGALYEFSLNNIDFFGNSNSYVFDGLLAGTYTVYARDVNQCETTINENVFIIGYPSFFTPNGDGINDFWEIKGLDEELYQTLKINVYDRYGKLIIILDEKNNFAWDGTHLGTNLPNNDYWFQVNYGNGDKKTGHFSLKR